MSLFKLSKVVFIAVIGIVILISSGEVNAQSRREIERERQRIERENARYQREQERRYRNNGSGVSRRLEQRAANANFISGYNQGFQAGQFDRRKRKYNNSMSIATAVRTRTKVIRRASITSTGKVIFRDTTTATTE